MRLCLRHAGSEIDVPRGDFLIGRGSECQLALGDPSVSRKHALIRGRGEELVLEDLHSRNGVLLNGHKLERPTRLGAGDLIIVGNVGIAVVAAPEGMPAVRVDERPAPEPESVVTAVPATLSQRDSPFRLLNEVCARALDLGRTDEAESLIQNIATVWLARVGAGGKPFEVGELDETARLALRVAKASSNPSIVDWIFEAYGGPKLVLSAELIDALERFVQDGRHPAGPAFRQYVESLLDREASLSSLERFRLARLEKLLAAAG